MKIRKNKRAEFGDRLHCMVIEYQKSSHVLEAQSNLDLEDWLKAIADEQTKSVKSDDNFKKIQDSMKNK